MMKIKDPERFISWLAAVLQPICEAEPITMAKYIFALLKRDRPINELHNFLLSQLEEFLNNDTETFTILLLETLQNQSYLNENLADDKTEITISSSGEKSDTGEKSIDNSLEEEKPRSRSRSRSRSLVRSKSLKTKDLNSPSKLYKRDDHTNTSDEDEERGLYRKYRYNARSSTSKQSKLPNFKRRFRSPKNYTQSQSDSPVKKPKEDIFTEFKKSEDIEKKTLVRCIDFDEKGYCMKGDLCVFDHGKDPVVLTAGFNDVLHFQIAESSFTSSFTSSVPIVRVGQNVPVPFPIQPFPPAQNQQMYYPSTEGSYWVRGDNSGEQTYFQQKRELVSVPIINNQNRFKRKNFKKEDNNDSINKKKMFDYKRLGPKLSSNDLQLKNIPENFNNISSLNKSFMKFGKIINIQTISENKEATLTFSTSHEAQKAYQNIETVFGTLPITANWFPDNLAEVKPIEINYTTSLKKPKTLSLDNRNIETTMTNEKEDEVIKSSLIRKQEKVKKLPPNYSDTVTKSQQKLLDEQLLQLNKLLNVAPNIKGENRQKMMATIMTLTTNSENIQAEVASAIKKPIIFQSPSKIVKSVPLKTSTKDDKISESKQEVLTHLLLIDLDLFIKQQQGNIDLKEIINLKKNVLALRSKLKILGISPASRTAKTAYQMKEKLAIANKLLEAKNKVRETTASISVDHRPTQLLVSGYEVNEEDKIINHFLQFGNIIEYSSDMIIPAFVIKYETRKDAEIAQFKGNVFQDRKLSVTWYNSEYDSVDTSNVKPGPRRSALVLENQDFSSMNNEDRTPMNC